MFDIYNFVTNNLFPTLPPELYFIIPIGCFMVLLTIMLLVISPFIAMYMIVKR